MVDGGRLESEVGMESWCQKVGIEIGVRRSSDGLSRESEIKVGVRKLVSEAGILCMKVKS